MTLLSNTTRKAVAAAIVAAAAFTTVAAPARAEYKIGPSHAKITKKLIHSLWCGKGSGDVVAHPIIRNLTGKTIPAGRTINWTAKYANGTKISGSYKLRAPLVHGATLTMSKYLPWNFTCKASVFI